MNKKCIGCGSTFQSKDKEKEGYIREEKINDAKYCERCFKIMHYGKSYLLDKKVLKDELIKEVNKSKKAVLYLVDVTSISEETLSPLKELTNKVYVLLTKKDLLPRSVKDYKLINYIKENYIDTDVMVISSEKKYMIDNLYNKLIKDKTKEYYCLGYSNAGKSSLINSLLNSIGKEANITVSALPNTTTEQINIKFNDELTIIDTPGFINKKSIVNFIDINDYKRSISKKEIKPKIYFLRKDFMILLSNLIRIENNGDNISNMIFYLGNNINFNKLRSIRNNNLKDLEHINLKVKKDEDIVIEGLGFIKIMNDSTLDFYVPNKTIISIRKKMI